MRIAANSKFDLLRVYNVCCNLCLCSYRDPVIRSLIPLRNVINEICKNQMFQSVPTISSFEEFFRNIETDAYQKLHFTHSYVQFYQDRFETDDGCMAVVFANWEVIRSVSTSKLMYVDASFKIDSTESYVYQLVTVLVWVDDSVSKYFTYF